MSRTLFALLIGLGSLWCRPVAAQDSAPEQDGATDEARVHFRTAMEHYDAGRFREAAAEFQQSYDLSHRPELLHNIYLSRRDMGDIRGAVEALRLYLTEATIPEADRTTLVHRLHGMESSLGQPVSSDPIPAAAPPVEEPAPPSEPVVEATHEASPPITPPPAAHDGTVETTGWVLALGAVVPAIVAAVGGALMLQERDSLYGMCNAGASHTDCGAGVDVDGATSRFGVDRALLWSGVGVGAAMLATGVVMILLGADASSSDTAPSVACTPDGCFASAGIHF